MLPTLFLAVACCAQQFSLQDEKGKTVGPFLLKNGTEVAVGANKAVITGVRTQKDLILDAMREIIIPQVEFKQAAIRDVVTFLQKAAVEFDPKKRGINIVLELTAEQEQALQASPITLSAKNVGLLDLLRVATDIGHVKYRVRGGIVTLLPVDAPEDDLYIRRYTVLPTFSERIRSYGTGSTNQLDDWKQFYAGFGVSWPAGSSIQYHASFGKMVVCNTRENLDLMGQILQEMGTMRRQIQIEMQFVVFDLTNITRIAATGVNTATLTALWTNGCGELIAAPMGITRSGQEMVVKGVTEVLYPTEFTYEAGSLSNASPTDAHGLVLPGGFEMRETGVVLSVVAEVAAEGDVINLISSPQLVDDPVWHDFGSGDPVLADKERRSQLKQPFFHSFQTSTCVLVSSGHRVLFGGGMPTRDRKRLVYIFVTATLVDMQGRVIQVLADDEVPDQPVVK
jgi:hypothetical protein